MTLVPIPVYRNSTSAESLPVQSASEDSALFSHLRELIEKDSFPAAIAELLNLFAVVSSEKEAIQCYHFLFHLLPHFTSFDTLENNLPHLLSRFPTLTESQLELAIQLGTYFQNRHCDQDAMHAFAKALQINPEKQVHRIASKLFAQLLIQRLDQFLINSTPSVETLQRSLEQIETFKVFCLSKEDAQPFYTKALNRINNIPFERQASYGSLRSEILKQQTLFQEPLLIATQRYGDALQAFRQSFSYPLTDIRDFQRHVTQKFKEMFKVFLDDIFILLGPPPCSYDIRAMGSLGREEVCPYSDLEFLILIENTQHRPYFKRLVEILEIQIASLGETSRFNFFFTCIQRSNPNFSGLHVDNSPTQEEKLIGTPAEMANLQQGDILGPQEIAYTSLKTASLAQNTPHLHDQFLNHLKTESSLPKRVFTAFEVRQQDYRIRWKNPPNFQTGTFNIKEDFVELLNHLLCDMALDYGIRVTNTLDIIDVLIHQGCFTKESGLLLKECVASLYAIRIRMHLYYTEQKEKASCPHFQGDLQLFSLSLKEISSLEKTYWLVLQPLYSSLQKVNTPSDFKAIFQKIDLAHTAFQENFASPSKPLIEHLVSHLCQINAPLKIHLDYFQALSTLEDESLRTPYLEIVEKNHSEAIFQGLIRIPNRSGLRPLFLRNFDRLKQGLLAITESLDRQSTQIPIEPIVLISALHFTQPRYLKPAAVQEMLTGENIKAFYAGSSHSVYPLSHQGYDFHFKQKPSHPLMEYAIHNLCSRIAGDLTPTTLLVRFDVQTQGKIKSYPVLVSQTLPGIPLKQALQEKQDRSYDLRQYTWMLLLSILTRPGDGRLSNYLVDDQQRLYCVDNDISFVEPVVKEYFSKTVHFHSALFCILPLDTQLHVEVLIEFCTLDANAIFDAWIKDIIQKEKEYTSLFSEKERAALFTEDPNNTFTTTILFREGTLATLNLQFFRLQNAIQLILDNHEVFTAGQLLTTLISLREEAIGTYVYKAYNNAGTTPEKKLQQAISSKQEASITSAQSHHACLGKIPTLQEVEKSKLYAPEKARQEFFFTLLQRSSHFASVKSRQDEISIEANFSQLKKEPQREALVLKALTEQLKLMKQKPAIVMLNHSTVLTTALLEPFLHAKLEKLDLRYCDKIDYSTLVLIQKYCPHLKELSLAGCQNLTDITASFFNPLLEFPTLEDLDISHCSHLRTLQLKADLLKSLKGNNNPSLQEVNLTTYNALEHLDLRYCPNIKNENLYDVVTKCPVLKELFLAGCTGLIQLRLITESLKHLDLQDCAHLTHVYNDSMQTLNGIKSNFKNSPQAKFLDIGPFGKKRWAKYFGDIGVEPPLPQDIDQILNSPCPFWPDKKVRETHLLVLIPATVNNQPFTLKSLGELIKTPKTGPATQLAALFLGDYQDNPVPQSYWILMSRDVLEGSRKKNYQTQFAQVASLAQKTGIAYAAPTVLEAATCILMHHVRTGQKLYSNNPMTYTRCQECYSQNWQMIVGGFASNGLHVGSANYRDEGDGVGAVRKFLGH